MTEDGSLLSIATSDGMVVITGEIDAHTAPRVSAALDAAPSNGGAVSVDMSGVEFVDSSGLRVLIDFHQSAAERGLALQLVRPSAAVMRVLEISGVDDYLDVVTD